MAHAQLAEHRVKNSGSRTRKQIYHLTLRSNQGFVESLFELMNVNLKVPSYSRTCCRQKSIKLPKLPTLLEGIHVVIDSSGLKIFGESEWKVRQHGYDKRRTWRKLHIGIEMTLLGMPASMPTSAN